MRPRQGRCIHSTDKSHLKRHKGANLGLIISTENERKQADAKAYEIAATMEAYSKVDAAVLEAMTMAKLDPQQLLALGIRELASGADKIGQFNLAPDLLQAISGQLSHQGRE